MTDKKQKPRPPERHPYHQPKLRIHGNLRTLTMGTMKAGAMDDGGSPKPNTRAGGPSG